MTNNDISTIASKNASTESSIESKIQTRYECAQIWETTFKELGEDVLRRIQDYKKTDPGESFHYVGNSRIRWPPAMINDLFYSITPAGVVIGKPVLTLYQSHNSTPNKTIEIIVQTTDDIVGRIAWKAIEEFNRQKNTQFIPYIQPGSRMDELRHRR